MEKEKPYNVMRHIRMNDINLVPRYLFEQVDRDWEVNKVYELASFINTSPLTLLWAFINDDHEIKGVLWCTINLLNESVFINVLSIDKDYQKTGRYSLIVKDLLAKTKLELGLKNIRWLTTIPEVFEKFGFKRTKYFYMEV